MEGIPKRETGQNSSKGDVSNVVPCLPLPAAGGVGNKHSYVVDGEALGRPHLPALPLVGLERSDCRHPSFWWGSAYRPLKESGARAWPGCQTWMTYTSR